MMTVLMDSSSALPSRELVQRLYKKNIELENGLRKSAQSKIPSDPNAWLQMRENYETILLEDHEFSERHEVEYALWQLHYRRIEEFRAHINAASGAMGSITTQGGKGIPRPERIKKIRSIFKSFLSEATGFYHDLMLKIRAKYGLPLGHFSEGPDNQFTMLKDEKKSSEVKKGLMSCHRCLIYLGDLSRYKGLYGEGDSVSRDYAAASSYYVQAASLCPSSGNPHHQLAILASYAGDDLMAVYRYFRSLAVDYPFSTARDNLIIAFEKNRQSYSQLVGSAKPGLKFRPKSNVRGRGRGDARLLAKDVKTEANPTNERELSIPEIYKSFSTRFVRLNGVLFTRTSLETFGEIFSLVMSDLHELLSSGPEEELNFGSDAAENGLIVVRLITILIYTVHNVNRESEGQSYAEILQRSVLLQNAFTAAFEFVGHIIKRCMQLRDAFSSYLLPGILVFIEWLACRPDIATGIEMEEKQAAASLFFWNQCVSFMNKLLLSGIVSVGGEEDESCFFDMSRYDEGQSGNWLAFWEDFELRGFSPLAPAQLILDFSSKQSSGSDGSNNEKKARVERILAAGRTLMNVVRVGNQGIFFDPKLKKFFIGAEPHKYEDDLQINFSDTFKGNDVIQAPVESTVKRVIQSKEQLNDGGDEDDDEVIVFKPTVAEKYPNALKSAAYEISQASQNQGNFSSFIDANPDPWIRKLPPTVNSSSHLSFDATKTIKQPVQHISLVTSKWFQDQGVLISDGLKNLRMRENGLGTSPGLQEDLAAFKLSSASLPSVSTNANFNRMTSSQTEVPEAVIPSRFDSIVSSGVDSDSHATKLSTTSGLHVRKNPVSRPIRHLGPPPGFSLGSTKHLEISSVLAEQQTPVDDYSWLDGFQLPSPKGLESETSRGHTAQSAYLHPGTGSNYSLMGAMNFPFPGKQISTVPAKFEIERSWQDYQPIEHLKLYPGQQFGLENQQAAPLPEQHQEQPLWPSRFYV